MIDYEWHWTGPLCCCRNTPRPGSTPTSSRRRSGLCKAADDAEEPATRSAWRQEEQRRSWYKMPRLHVLLILPASRGFSLAANWCCVTKVQTWIACGLVLKNDNNLSQLEVYTCKSQKKRRTLKKKKEKKSTPCTNPHHWSERPSASATSLTRGRKLQTRSDRFGRVNIASMFRYWSFPYGKTKMLCGKMWTSCGRFLLTEAASC